MSGYQGGGKPSGVSAGGVPGIEHAEGMEFRLGEQLARQVQTNRSSLLGEERGGGFLAENWHLQCNLYPRVPFVLWWKQRYQDLGGRVLRVVQNRYSPRISSLFI